MRYIARKQRKFDFCCGIEGGGRIYFAVYNDSNLFHRLEATVKDTSEPCTDRMCLIDPFYCDGHNKFMEENILGEGETEVRRAQVRGGRRRASEKTRALISSLIVNRYTMLKLPGKCWKWFASGSVLKLRWERN